MNFVLQENSGSGGGFTVAVAGGGFVPNPSGILEVINGVERTLGGAFDPVFGNLFADRA